MKHKSPDYKLSAVKYYLNNKDGYDKTCKIFDCKKSSIKRWIHTYNTTKTLTRKNRNPVSYKINKEQVYSLCSSFPRYPIIPHILMFSVNIYIENILSFYFRFYIDK
jgi:transposase